MVARSTLRKSGSMEFTTSIGMSTQKATVPAGSGLVVVVLDLLTHKEYERVFGY